jgi:hypothetical protein
MIREEQAQKRAERLCVPGCAVCGGTGRVAGLDGTTGKPIGMQPCPRKRHQ